MVEALEHALQLALAWLYLLQENTTWSICHKSVDPPAMHPLLLLKIEHAGEQLGSRADRCASSG